MNDEDRKARNRRYAAESRARKKAAEAAALAASQQSGRELGELERALESSLSAMKWLAPSDEALVAIARSLARQADALSTVHTEAASGRMIRMQLALAKVLDQLCGTPAQRIRFELRSARAGVVFGAPVTPALAAGGNVSRFERPARRR